MLKRHYGHTEVYRMAEETIRLKAVNAQLLKACKSARGYFGPSHGPPLCAEDAIGQELRAAIAKSEGTECTTPK